MGEANFITSKSAFEISTLKSSHEIKEQTTDVLVTLCQPRSLLDIQKLPFMDVTRPSAHCEAVETLFLNLTDKGDVADAWLKSNRSESVWRARKLMHEHPQYQKDFSGVVKACFDAEELPTDALDAAELYRKDYPFAGRWFNNNVEIIQTMRKVKQSAKEQPLYVSVSNMVKRVQRVAAAQTIAHYDIALWSDFPEIMGLAHRNAHQLRLDGIYQKMLNAMESKYLFQGGIEPYDLFTTIWKTHPVTSASESIKWQVSKIRNGTDPYVGKLLKP